MCSIPNPNNVYLTQADKDASRERMAAANAKAAPLERGALAAATFQEGVKVNDLANQRGAEAERNANAPRQEAQNPIGGTQANRRRGSGSSMAGSTLLTGNAGVTNLNLSSKSLLGA